MATMARTLIFYIYHRVIVATPTARDGKFARQLLLLVVPPDFSPDKTLKFSPSGGKFRQFIASLLPAGHMTVDFRHLPIIYC
jgi:hypothetical protein